MKEKYLEELKYALNERGIYDSEIIAKYERRYNLGKEAGLSDEDILDMLGSPSDVAAKIFAEGFKDETNKEAEYNSYYEDNYEVDISTVADNIEIIFDDIEKPCYQTNNVDLYNYEIIENPEVFSFKFKKMRFLALYRTTGSISIRLPKKYMSSMVVKSTEGHIDIKGNIVAKYFCVEAISGYIRLEDIDSTYTNIKTVSGKAACNTLLAREAILGTVSGGIAVKYIRSDELSIESISGTIIIDEANASINATTISGNVMVNGKEFGNNIKNKVKDFFR
ncbi:MAG: DUF4097 family beta strand repeat protein [Acholeplasmatales bacterium]|nr:DUF4097 family beta strand repeat protein [Acholeplasmatales bacterium]